MADDNIRQLVAQGLTALRAGSRVAQDATQDIQSDARDPDLRQALEQGTRTSR